MKVVECDAVSLVTWLQNYNCSFGLRINPLNLMVAELVNPPNEDKC